MSLINTLAARLEFALAETVRQEVGGGHRCASPVHEIVGYGRLHYSMEGTREGELFREYAPVRGELAVDGVIYRRRGNYCENPMITLKYDNECLGSDAAIMRFSQAPTEAELDEWVLRRTMGGFLLGDD